MEYSKDQLIKVTNKSRGSVSYQSDYSKRKRRWDRPGIIRDISFGEIEDQVLSTGGFNLFSNYLLVLDEGVRVELGLPNDKMSTMSIEDITRVLNGNISNLKVVLENGTAPLLNSVAHQATTLKIDSIEKLSLIEKYTGIKMVQIAEEVSKSEDTKPAKTSTIKK